MKNKTLFLWGIICIVSFIAFGCGQKTKVYDIKDDGSNSKVQMVLKSEDKNDLDFVYVGNKIDSGVVNDDGTITLYTEDQKKEQIDKLGRENTLEIVEENGLTINYTAHPSDNLSTFSEDYDEYVYTVGDRENEGIASIHILSNEEAFKNRLESIKNNYVPTGVDLYSDGLNIQGFKMDDNSPYGNIEMKWFPESHIGYMIEINSPDYTFEDISCMVNLKNEIDNDEDYQEAKASKEAMTEYISDVVKESEEIERIVYQDNIAGWGLDLYDEDGYIVSGVSLYDENGDIIYVGADKDHKWCYDKRGWVVRADTVDVPYTLSEKGYTVGDYDTRYGTLVPIQ